MTDGTNREICPASSPDGRVLVAARNTDPRNRRVAAYSPDGATGWSKPELIGDLLEPGCMAGEELCAEHCITAATPAARPAQETAEGTVQGWIARNGKLKVARAVAGPQARSLRKPGVRLGAAQAAAFAPLVAERNPPTADEGPFTVIELPPLNPWGVLVISQAP